MEENKQCQINNFLSLSEREEEVENSLYRKYYGINALDGISNPRLGMSKLKELIEKGIPIYDKNGLPVDNITLENIKDIKYEIAADIDDQSKELVRTHFKSDDIYISANTIHTKMEDGIITDCGVKYNIPVNLEIFNPETNVYQMSEEPICNYVFNLNKNVI